jgi:hypothetical protein
MQWPNSGDLTSSPMNNITKIREALEKAVDRGYRVEQKDFLLKLPEFALCQVWLDPLFWQCLGKAMGWEEVEMSDPHRAVNGKAEWHNNWHRFIDHISESKDAESFFANLLQNNE